MTQVYDAMSLTQPEMSMSIREIVERFAFVGDTPLGMMNFPEPSLREDEKLFNAPDLDNLAIQELEQLSASLMERANWLRSQRPPEEPAPDADIKPSPDDVPAEK